MNLKIIYIIFLFSGLVLFIGCNSKTTEPYEGSYFHIIGPTKLNGETRS